MNNFYKKPVNNIVEQMNVNYENYQSKLNSLQNNDSENEKKDNIGENQQKSENNTNNILNNPMLSNLIGNNNIANLLPLLNGNNGLNLANLPNKNELIMKLLSNMNGNPQTKTLTNSAKTDIDNLTKIDDYDFL